MEAQGYTVLQNVIYQENKSVITLEHRGKSSSSKRTKHIQVQHFFIKDKIEKGEVEVKYFPTEQMWSDILTNPKQGKAFREIRAQLINCPDD